MAKIKQLFVTGTDTGVGKTIVAAILASGLGGNYWKPIQCGLQEATDTDFVRKISGLPDDHFYSETYRLAAPLSPHAAAEMENVHIELDHFTLPEENPGRTLIVEGAGGIMVPLNQQFFMIDLMKKLNIPIVLVARSTLGTINHTLLSLRMLRSYGLEVLGVVMNGPKNKGNKLALEKFGEVQILAEIEMIPDLNSVDLPRCFKCFSTTLFK